MIDWLSFSSKLATIKCQETFKRMTNLFNLVIQLKYLFQAIKLHNHSKCLVNNQVVNMVSHHFSQVLMSNKQTATTDNKMWVVLDTDSPKILMVNNQWGMDSNLWDMVSNQWDNMVSNQWDMVNSQWVMDNQVNRITPIILQLNQVNFTACHHHNNHQSEID